MKYNKVDLGALQKMSFQAFAKTDWFKAERCNTPYTARLLPNDDNTGPALIEAWEHKGGMDGWTIDGKRRVIACLGDGCPVCEVHFWAEENDENELAEKCSVSTSYYAKVIDRATGTVKNWSPTSGMLKEMQPYLRKYGNVADPKRGRDFDVVKTGEDHSWKTWRYKVVFDDPSPIGMADWEKQRGDVTKLVRTWSLEEVDAALHANLGHQYPMNTVLGKASKAPQSPAKATKAASPTRSKGKR